MPTILALDLGQTSDPSAAAVLRERDRAPGTLEAHWDCPYLHRFPLGTPYPDIVRRTNLLLLQLLGPFDAEGRCVDSQGRPAEREVLLVPDQTAVGRPVVDMFRLPWREPLPPAVAALFGGPVEPARLPDLAAAALRRVRLLPVTITFGTGSRRAPNGDWHVAKKDLVAGLLEMLGYRRLSVAEDQPEAKVLARELAAFRVKLTRAANEVYGAHRESDHDDLVLALALGAWAARKRPWKRLKVW